MTIGAGMSYCNNINRHTIINQDAGVKVIYLPRKKSYFLFISTYLYQRFVYRRLARSLNRDSELYRKGQEVDIETDVCII